MAERGGAKRFTAEHVRELARCAGSFGYWLPRYGRISDQVLGDIPFEVWPCHKRCVTALEEHRLIVVLKARQIGLSWLFGALYPVWLTAFHPGKTALLFSWRDDESAGLIRKCRYAWSKLPVWMQPGLAKDNEMELVLADLDSRIKAFPSSPNAGSGEAASYVLSDEHAKQPNAEVQYAAIRPTMDMGGQHVSVSTAQGMETLHYTLYSEATAGRNGYTPLFFGYDEHPRRDEAWWENTRRTFPQQWMFFQEYPRDPDEAFQSSVPRRFAPEHCVVSASRTEPLTDVGANEDALALLTIRPKVGELGCRIYQPVDYAKSYVIGADVAEGFVGGDAQAALVLCRETGEEVASLHGRWPVKQFAHYLDRLANYYRATLGIERNSGYGVSCVDEVQQLILERLKTNRRPSYRLYHETPVLTAQGHEAKPSKPGWLTSPRTKPLMMEALDAALISKDLRLATEAVCVELRGMVVDEAGDVKPESKRSHDDFVIAAAIAWQMVVRTQVPRARAAVPYHWGAAAPARGGGGGSLLATLTGRPPRVVVDAAADAVRSTRRRIGRPRRGSLWGAGLG